MEQNEAVREAVRGTKARHWHAKSDRVTASRTLYVVLGVATFLVTLIFFTRVCPLVPSDADDWGLMAKVRSGLPEWGGFNPAKVFPETSLRLVNFLAAFCVMPFVGGDYVWSLVVAAAILASAFVAGYVLSFAWVLKRVLGCGTSAIVSATALFYLSHFVLLSHTGGGTIPFLLGTRDYTCVFHYTIPYLLCATVAMTLMCRGAAPEPKDGYKETPLGLAVLMLGIYLGMFSNLFLNIVLAAFSGACLVASLAQIGARERRAWTLGSFVRHNCFHFVILALWLASLAFELSGNRASGALEGEGGSGFHLGAVLVDLHATLACLNRGTALLFLAVLAIALVLGRRNMDNSGKSASPFNLFARLPFVSIIWWLLAAAFIVLLSSVVDPYTQTVPPIRYYASRPDVLVSAVCPLLILCCMAFAYVVEKWRLANMLSLVVVFVVAVGAVGGIGRYEQPVRGNITAGQTLVSAEDMVAQVIAADKAGKSSVEVHVLAFHNDYAYNWPLAPGLADGLAEDLYGAGVTSQRMTITIVPDTAVNARLGLPDDIGGSAVSAGQ